MKVCLRVFYFMHIHTITVDVYIFTTRRIHSLVSAGYAMYGTVRLH